MKKKLLILFNLICIILLASCKEKNNSLENALAIAGDNRQELEKVLSHYSQKPEDNLKYQAACFLIENMPGHYSYKDTSYINRYHHQLDSVALIYKNQNNTVKDSLFRQVRDLYTENQGFVPDIHIIKANYLIDNIDRSFDVWLNGEWSLHINFDDFCEYILPYKSCEGQILDNWRAYFKDYCNGNIKKLHYCHLFKNAAYNACEAVNRALKDSTKPRLVNEPGIIPVRKMNTLTQIPFGVCEDYNILALSVMRAKGIPTIMDFTPQWPFRSLGHSWNVLIETSGKKVVYEGTGQSPATPHKEEHPMAKVFRKTYAINKEILEIHGKEKYIPSTFNNLFMKDVTPEYLTTCDINLSIESSHKHTYAYLAVFDNEKWVPIHYGKISKKDKVTFDKMGKRIVYLPVFYEATGIKPFSAPIILTVSGNQVQLIPDTLTRQTLVLKRKFPPFENLYKVAERVVGGKFQIATDSLFKDSTTIHTITELGIYAQSVDLSEADDSARYWRYYPPNGAHCNMAELFFYEKDSIQPTIGKIIGTQGSFRKGNQYAKEATFDRDALTFFDAPEKNGCWVGLDFGKPVKIDHIVYLPRNDGNCIEIGDEYELLYWGNNKWQSLGRKTADYIALTYENCPSNALFLLRNLTKGKEERIFTYEHGKQVWW
ncbi:transglutaminase domain-containing protein [Bacteroides sp. 224]|uniref:transglutaminase domain-containing protein n=1 Tax=Bacteroides sp. 224 TaxID=2302936 RepID=UPI0013D19A8A|nr:transglutaminase domain-containing protein [Bacteroides sp. 224]